MTQPQAHQEESVKEQLNEPSLYNVILLNDDYTPMDFVEFILIDLFLFNSEKAAILTQQIHTSGSAIAGTFSKDIAETKAQLTIATAKKNEYPLLAKIEKVE